MPRRIPDYADAFTSWNVISSFGSLISVMSTVLFVYIIFDIFANGERVNENPWAVPSYFTSVSKFNKETITGNSLEWNIPSPMPLHAFNILPKQSTSNFSENPNPQAPLFESSRWETGIADKSYLNNNTFKSTQGSSSFSDWFYKTSLVKAINKARKWLVDIWVYLILNQIVYNNNEKRILFILSYIWSTNYNIGLSKVKKWAYYKWIVIYINFFLYFLLFSILTI